MLTTGHTFALCLRLSFSSLVPKSIAEPVVTNAMNMEYNQYTVSFNTVSESKKSEVEQTMDRLCGLLVRVPGYSSRGPSSIPGATIFSEK
jgi:hypothetical protein